MRTRGHIKVVNYFKKVGYRRLFWKDYDFSELNKIIYKKKPGKSSVSYSNAIMMFDTETSKKRNKEDNHIVAWSIAIRSFGLNICCLWGQNPRELVECMSLIRKNLSGDKVYFYAHNLPYDWTFCRKFMMEKWGEPEDQLNIRPMYPLFIDFGNGITLKDSLMLAQRSLEKWANDLKVPIKKASGLWDYDKLRNQSDKLSDNELKYIEHDVVAGVMCLDVTMNALSKNLGSIPMTATGIPRNDLRDIGKSHKAHDKFKNIVSDEWIFHLFEESIFHGGYTHNNRYYMGRVMEAFCKDFASSYPFIDLAFKFPMEKFWKLDWDLDKPDNIFKNENYAFLFSLRVTGLRLKNKRDPMPPLAHAKVEESLNCITDNGKVMSADYLQVNMCEVDLRIFCQRYEWDSMRIYNVYTAWKDYLPRWFTDYIFKCFEDKTHLKGVDPVLYQLAKGKLNAASYGMIAQHPVREVITENYQTGEYDIDSDMDSMSAEYEKYINKFNSIFPYQWAIYITAYAQDNLYRLSECIADDGIWLYSDTDSIYATKFDEKKVSEYNNRCKEMLRANGYGPVIWKDREYWLGVAEDDGHYAEFKGLHAKCYCKRKFKAAGDNFIMMDNLEITVAGVPKKGAVSLHNKIDNFNTFTIFPGKESGKLQHKHIYVDEIYTDENGNLTGDSIDLTPCDYLIKDANIPTDIEELERLFESEVTIQAYEEIFG